MTKPWKAATGADATGMEIITADIPDVLLIRPGRHEDERGLFMETYQRERFARAGIVADFVQDNHSSSRSPHVLRGLHFQAPPHDQGKLVRAACGAVFDVAVDIRHGSPTFGRHVSAVLSAENGLQMWIPPGFAHGYCTIAPDTVFLYKVTRPYAPDHDHGIAWDDPDLAIPWPLPEGARPVLSERDGRNPRLRDLPAFFRHVSMT